jgi:holo-[acyl-carrier protein] synthase
MIKGIGTDICEIARIEHSLESLGDVFAHRILTEGEFIEYQASPNGAQFIAKRWAAKEAFGKACGTGLRAPLTWHALQIVHDSLGAPRIVVNQTLQDFLHQRGMIRWHISISDERRHAVAFAIVEGDSV